MKTKPTKFCERYRIRKGPLPSSSGAGNNGAFSFRRHGEELHVIISDGEGWDHVSVSGQYRTPTWEEMHFIKTQFFRDDEAVFQIHPPKRLYVNHQRNTLHLWRPQGVEIPLPPLECV